MLPEYERKRSAQHLRERKFCFLRKQKSLKQSNTQSKTPPPIFTKISVSKVRTWLFGWMLCYCPWKDKYFHSTVGVRVICECGLCVGDCGMLISLRRMLCTTRHLTRSRHEAVLAERKNSYANAKFCVTHHDSVVFKIHLKHNCCHCIQGEHFVLCVTNAKDVFWRWKSFSICTQVFTALYTFTWETNSTQPSGTCNSYRGSHSPGQSKFPDPFFALKLPDVQEFSQNDYFARLEMVFIQVFQNQLVLFSTLNIRTVNVECITYKLPNRDDQGGGALCRGECLSSVEGGVDWHWSRGSVGHDLDADQALLF